MIKNFLSVINRYGFIPNGGRIYYLARSQPPLLSGISKINIFELKVCIFKNDLITGMIKAYLDITQDYDFAIDAVELLEREFNYFMTTKMVDVKGHKLARYIDASNGPRPESYREDFSIGQTFETVEEREDFYSECKAAGESGMDFSSRWFINENGENNGTLKDLKTRSIIPVELNSILYWNARIIAEIYGYAKNETKRVEYEKRADEIFLAVNEVLWDNELGTWLDYDLINNKLRQYFTPTNLAPLWTNCFNLSQREIIAEKVLAYIDNLKLDAFPGGVPNTLFNTGEQWDMPNVWAPMQYLLIYGLENLQNPRASDLAFKWAQKWVQSNYVAFRKTGAMYEKYVATNFGSIGGGGEYDIQKGFGWSNGVILELLSKYGGELQSPGDFSII